MSQTLVGSQKVSKTMVWHQKMSEITIMLLEVSETRSWRHTVSDTLFPPPSIMSKWRGLRGLVLRSAASSSAKRACSAGSCVCEGNFIGEFCETECPIPDCGAHVTFDTGSIEAAREANRVGERPDERVASPMCVVRRETVRALSLIHI